MILSGGVGRDFWRQRGNGVVAVAVAVALAVVGIGDVVVLSCLFPHSHISHCSFAPGPPFPPPKATPAIVLRLGMASMGIPRTPTRTSPCPIAACSQPPYPPSLRSCLEPTQHLPS